MASIMKVQIIEFGQERAAALDVWPVLDISDMNECEFSFAFEDGIESVEDTIGFKGGMHPRETGFFVFEHGRKNRITYSPLQDILCIQLAMRWYDNAGDWRAGAAEKPLDSSLQYSLVEDEWVTEEELSKETLGDRKRKYGVYMDTLYK